MQIVAIVGTYRKGGIIDTAVEEILGAARKEGAETEKIMLIDRHIEFCTNCRSCTQQPGIKRGKCVLDDDMNGILEKVDKADAVVIASPMNCGTVTAVMKKFIERQVCFLYWPWGMKVPKIRNSLKEKQAVLVASSAAPALLARLTSRLVKLLKESAALLGARTIGVLFIGLAAKETKQDIGSSARKKARVLGRQLVLVHK